MTMPWRRILTRGIAESVALARSGAVPQAGLRILMYHAVGSPAVGDSLGIYNISPKLFAQQAAALAAHHHEKIVSLENGMQSSETLRIAVTFDDGYRDNLYCAAPILRELEIPFTVFVCTGFIQESSGRYLSKNDLRELSTLDGVSIGSHGATHELMTKLDSRKLRVELASSKKLLEDITGRPVSTLSYPHGAVDARVRDAAVEAGYLIGACSRFDINSPTRDPLMLCRTDILGIDSLRVFKQKIRGDWDWYRWRAPDVSAP